MNDRNTPTSRIVVYLVTAGCWLLACGNASTASRCFADEIPEGFAEKSMAVVVRDANVFIEYHIGMNPKDIRKACAEWNFETDGSSDSELLETFASGLADYLPDHLKLTVDGESVAPHVDIVRSGGQHHVSAYIRLTCQLPAADTSAPHVYAFRVTDESFATMSGAIRLGCKAQGQAMLRQSNAATVIVRADRTDYSGLSAEERREAQTIQSSILLTPK